MPDFLQRFAQTTAEGEYEFSNVRSGLIVALLSIGTLIGALIAAPIADSIGRRLSISLWCIVCAIGFVIQIATVDAWYQVSFVHDFDDCLHCQFMIGRLIAGFGVGALSLLVSRAQQH